MAGPTFRFTPDETDMLAQREHERWLAERRATGWTWGERKDLVKRTNPSLVAWNDLAQETRHYNREAVRRIPYVLAKADLEITRGESEPRRYEPIRPVRRESYSQQAS
jgi:hypothetical protein